MSSSPATMTSLPDVDIRKRVVEGVAESFIVQAPAGSGKTELLTQRFLSLLATVEEPESVLAVTFTRKAASEMRIRVLKALDSAMAKADDDEEPHKARRRELASAVLEADRRFGWRLMENPMRLQIRTVDSLAESIARQLPLLAEVSGDLQVTEDARELYGEAADRTIAEIGGGGSVSDAVATLLRYLDNNAAKLRELLVSMLRKRDQWLRIVGGNQVTDEELPALRSALESALRRAVEEDLRKIRAAFVSACGKHAAEFIRLTREASGLTQMGAGVPKASADELDCWRAIVKLMLTQAGELRKKVDSRVGLQTAGDKYSCTQILADLACDEESAKTLCTSLGRVNKLPDVRYSDDEWKFVRALLMILPRSAAQLKVVFADESKVDFAELSMAAVSALETDEGPTELGLALGSQVKHLLVDEFQDTSQSQLGLVNALTRTWEPESGNSLFLVGDPMQSIYAFREAEVTIFTRAFDAETRAGRGLQWPVTPLKLTANFRSQRGLVEWFNETHSEIMTRKDDATGAVEYAAAVAVKSGEPDAVVLQAFQTKAYRAEAEFVAREVEAALKNDDDRIAILVRARAHLVSIVRELKRRDIRYRAVKIDELAKRQTVLDLDALTRALLDPADREAWLSVLRAPWCGLKLADLWELCKGDSDATILSLLESRTNKLSEDGRRRAERIARVMRRSIAESANTSLRILVEKTWIELGGPATFPVEEAAACELDASAYLEFLEESQAAGMRPGTNRFRARLKELYAPAASDPDIRVDLMTIHGAKGLEWDVVFLPALGRMPKGEDKQLLYWREQQRDGEDELLLGPMRSVKVPDPERTIECYLQAAAAERAREEKKRLLYVATTRAKKRLYLTATMEQKGTPNKSSLLALLCPVEEVANAFAASLPEEAVNDEAEETGRLGTQVLRRLPTGYSLPEYPAPLIVEGKLEKPKGEEKLHTFDWAGETRRRVGTVTHAFLQAISCEGLERWNAARVDAAKSSIRTALATEGVGPEKLESAAGEVMTALRNCLADERGRWILGASNEAAAELAVTAVVDGVPKRLKIDRTFVEGGVRWMIDFKTTQIEGGDSDRYFNDQVQKYRADLEQYARALRLLDPREIRCALYFPLQKELRVVPIGLGIE